ncbi:MAG: radical SAM protein [Myxococcales bacterium]|nr:radical SAM protein [Myxococcales bacterium]
MKSGRILKSSDHARDGAGMTYVYPVVSRRAGGVSVGINLNPNHACNFRCVYCQVPNLVYGKAPEIDLQLLQRELTDFLGHLLHGDFMERRVPEGARRLCDIAFSGNGEPTSVIDFEQICDLVATTMDAAGVSPEVKLRLITNGSLGHKTHVQRGVARMAQRNGQVWFKFDAGDDDTLAQINNFPGGVERQRRHLRAIASQCETWLQTCVFAWHGKPPSEQQLEAWLSVVADEVELGTPIAGVYLYGIARQSFQPEASELSQLSADWLLSYAERITARTGLLVEARV